MSEHGGCGQADLPRLPRALMIISLDFEQLSACVRVGCGNDQVRVVGKLE